MVSKNATFLSITDLHFNPCADPALTARLADAAPDEWAEIFESSTQKELVGWGKDTNYPLLNSLFKDVSAFSDADFILFSGDFLGHNLRERFQSATGDKSDAGFSRFIGKTLEFLAAAFQKAFPGKVIFPAMGNDDNICGDYEITPLGEFLSRFTDAWQPVMNRLDGDNTFAQTFPVGGYYTALLPGESHQRLIVLNNIFMARNYRDACGSVPGDPGEAQLNWLEWVLYLSRTNRESVWMVFHEPLGINMYQAIHGKNPHCASNVSTFIKSRYGDRLRTILLKSSDIIRVVFCGHTHMDEFRILHDGFNTPRIAMHITPSVSPIFGNNPAYQVFTLGDDYGPVDYSTRMIDLSLTRNPAEAGWVESYRFSEAYGQTNLDPVSLSGVGDAVADNTDIRQRYIEYFNVCQSTYSMINSDNWRAFYDCINDNTRDAFVKEYCPAHQSSLAGRSLHQKGTP
ncbi:MAG: metallophosphoesterase [Desulfobacterales bacterium]|nr:metallophosphoesterase [Desulfobacterales bacterium]